MKRITTLCFLLAFLMLESAGIRAQQDDSLSDFLKEAMADHAAFRDKALADHVAFRDSVLASLDEWARQKWVPKPLVKPQPKPHDEPPVPPIIIPHDEPTPQPKPEPVIVRPVVVKPAPVQPEPPKPVLPPKPEPVPTDINFKFRFYGTEIAVQAPANLKNSLQKTNFADISSAFASTMKVLDKDAFDVMYASLMAEANAHKYHDWAFLRLTDLFAKAYIPGNTNLQKIFQSLILVAAGYDIRMASSRETNRVYMLAGFREHIIGQGRWDMDGTSYYPLEDTPSTLQIMQKSFPKTRPMTAQPSGHEIFTSRPGKPHEVIVCLHKPHCPGNKCQTPAAKLSLVGNLNRMDFYTDCPQFILPDNEWAYWNTYAGAELSDAIKGQLYPDLRKLLAGKTKVEQVNILMNFVEAFPYELDTKVWGRDRAFFAEETLHYPFRDCEDGAILFTRIVRDLIRLPTALVYYPGHLAAAVAFDSDVRGAYIDMGGKRYTVCDPTYYYVPAGVQMPTPPVDPSKAVLIPIKH